MNILRLEVGDIVSIERENEPGNVQVCTVMEPDGNTMKFLVHDHDAPTPGRKQLLDYMKKNNITQVILAEILGIDRSTLSRYITGKIKSIPTKYFHKLGIQSVCTEMQYRVFMDKLFDIAQMLNTVTSQIDSMISGKED